jgi:hypothetical protein
VLQDLAQGAANGAFIVNQKNGWHDLDTWRLVEIHYEVRRILRQLARSATVTRPSRAAKLTLGTTSG